MALLTYLEHNTDNKIKISLFFCLIRSPDHCSSGTLSLPLTPGEGRKKLLPWHPNGAGDEKKDLWGVPAQLPIRGREEHEGVAMTWLASNP